MFDTSQYLACRRMRRGRQDDWVDTTESTWLSQHDWVTRRLSVNTTDTTQTTPLRMWRGRQDDWVNMTESTWLSQHDWVTRRLSQHDWHDSDNTAPHASAREMMRHKWVVSHARMRRVAGVTARKSFVCETWLSYTWDMTDSYVRHDSFVCVTWLIHMHALSLLVPAHAETTQYAWFMSRTRIRHVTCVEARMCDMTHLHVWHDPFVCVTRLIHMCDMSHSYARHDPFICATWLIHMCDMTGLYVRQNSFARVPWLIHPTLHHSRRTHTYKRVMSYIWLSHVTHTNKSCHIYETTSVRLLLHRRSWREKHHRGAHVHTHTHTLSLSLSFSLFHTHTIHTHTHTLTHTHTHTHTNAHMHTHTHIVQTDVERKATQRC